MRSSLPSGALGIAVKALVWKPSASPSRKAKSATSPSSNDRIFREVRGLALETAVS